MTDRIKQQVVALNKKIREYRAVLDEAILSGVSSASISTGGNSQSYTRFSIADIEKMIAKLESQKARLLRGSGGMGKRTVPDFEGI